MWLNRSIVTINAMFQRLYIYREREMGVLIRKKKTERDIK